MLVFLVIFSMLNVVRRCAFAINNSSIIRRLSTTMRQPSILINEMHVYYGLKGDISESTSSSASSEPSELTNDAEMMQIHYYMNSSVLNTMKRSLDEPIEKSLKRFYASVTKKLSKKNSKQEKSSKKSEKLGNPDSIQSEGSSLVLVSIDGVEQNVSGWTNKDWIDGMIVSCPTYDLSYTVRVNPPLISSISVFPRRIILSGCSVIPSVSTNNEDDLVLYQWYRRPKDSTEDDYEFISSSKIYIPTNSDVGCSLKLLCTPYREDKEIKYGRSVVYYLPGNVRPQPSSHGIRSSRESFINGNTDAKDSKLRVVTYNILAEPYAMSDFSIKNIYSYIDNQMFLDTEYRCQLALQELLAYDADIISLQECDEKTFINYFKPMFHSLGYACHHSNKDNLSREGCAMFIRDNALQLIEFLAIPISSCFKSANHLNSLLDKRPDIQSLLCDKLGMVVQIGVCRWRESNRILLLSNTHLFYHPNADYVRLLQVDAILQTLASMKTEIMITYPVEGQRLLSKSPLQSDTSEIQVTVILMGDLNSSPDSPAIQLIESGVVEPNHPVWATINNFSWGMRLEGHPDNIVETPSSIQAFHEVDISNSIPRLVNPFSKLQSSAGHPKYSNFTIGFKELLDWVFIEPEIFDTIKVAPIPSEQELSAESAIPNSVYPSDHISIATDIQWKS